jgi:hypothetical protein
MKLWYCSGDASHGCGGGEGREYSQLITSCIVSNSVIYVVHTTYMYHIHIYIYRYICIYRGRGGGFVLMTSNICFKKSFTFSMCILVQYKYSLHTITVER